MLFSLILQVLNKIDLPGAEPDRVIQEIEEVGDENENTVFYFWGKFIGKLILNQFANFFADYSFELLGFLDFC